MIHQAGTADVEKPCAGLHQTDPWPVEKAAGLPRQARGKDDEIRVPQRSMRVGSALSALRCRRTRIVQTSFGFSERLWLVSRPLFQGSRFGKGIRFSVVTVVSGETDPFRLSTGSPSIGQAAYPEKALMRRERTFARLRSKSRRAPKLTPVSTIEPQVRSGSRCPGSPIVCLRAR
jgi:hypothetical protein